MEKGQTVYRVLESTIYTEVYSDGMSMDNVYETPNEAIAAAGYKVPTIDDLWQTNQRERLSTLQTAFVYGVEKDPFDILGHANAYLEALNSIEETADEIYYGRRD